MFSLSLSGEGTMWLVQLPLVMLLSNNENTRGWIVLILLHVEDAPTFFFSASLLWHLAQTALKSSASQELSDCK